MTTIRLRLARFWRAEAGASLAEYGLLVLLVSLAALGAVQLFGTKIGDLYNRIVQQVVPALS